MGTLEYELNAPIRFVRGQSCILQSIEPPGIQNDELKGPKYRIHSEYPVQSTRLQDHQREKYTSSTQLQDMEPAKGLTTGAFRSERYIRHPGRKGFGVPLETGSHVRPQSDICKKADA